MSKEEIFKQALIKVNPLFNEENIDEALSGNDPDNDINEMTRAVYNAMDDYTEQLRAELEAVKKERDMFKRQYQEACDSVCDSAPENVIKPDIDYSEL